MKRNIFIVFLFIFILSGCIQPNTDKNNSSNQDTENSIFKDLSNTPEKEGLLSPKKAAQKALEDAIQSGDVEYFIKNNTELLNDVKLGDVVFVEDYNNTPMMKSELENYDNLIRHYYIMTATRKDNSIIAIGIVYSDSGKLGELSVMMPNSKLFLANKNVINEYVRNNSTLNKSSINTIKAEFIRTEDDYDRLDHWKWIVTLNDKVNTRYGNRSVFIITPFIDEPFVTRSNKISITNNNLPDYYDSRISVFKTEAEEINYINRDTNNKDKQMNRISSEDYRNPYSVVGIE